MGARLVDHPSANTLKAFALGNLDDETAESVVQHLVGCPQCCKRLESQSGDSFLAKLRQAHERSHTPAHAKALSTTPRTDAGTPLSQSLPPPIPDLPPQLAAHPEYTVIRELGRGGMGVVYEAWNKGMERREVLKVVDKDKLDRPGMLERFRREIVAAGQLSHQNVATAYRILELGELLAFAMEHVEGKDLRKVVMDRLAKGEGPLPVPNACYYAYQVALGLQHAHEKGLVHRDIKPGNLILSRTGRDHVVKILDFGLARVIREQPEDPALTDAGVAMGTPDYMAPEQALDAANADIRADVYGLGCTLYFLVAGRPPFEEESVLEVMLAHQTKEAPSLTVVRAGVPEGLAAVVRKALAKDPAARYQTPAEMARDLLPLVKGERKGSDEVAPKDTRSAPPVRRTATLPPPLPGARPRKQRRWPVALAAVACAVLPALVGLWAAGAVKVKTPPGRIVLENLPADADVLVDGAKEPAWVKLFNGKDLAGWFVESGEGSAWGVKDGELIAAAKDEGSKLYVEHGYLFSEREYSDFVLRFQYRQVGPKYSIGGIALRAIPRETARRANTGWLPDDDCPFHLTAFLTGQGRPTGAGRWQAPSGTLWWSAGAPEYQNLLPDRLPEVKGVGEWNDVQVEVRGQALRVVVNGGEVQNFALNRVKPQINPAPGLGRFLGCIGFMKRKGEVRYRNVEIQELKPSTPSPHAPGRPEPRVVSKWRFQVNGTKPQSSVIELYSNGRINSPDAADAWLQYDNVLVLRWKRGDGHGVWLDKCTLTSDGQRFTGQNQIGTPVSGVRIGDGAKTPPKAPETETQQMERLRRALIDHPWHYFDNLYPPGEVMRFHADGTFHTHRWKWWVVGPREMRIHYDRGRNDKENGIPMYFNDDLTAYSGEFTDPNRRVHKIAGKRQ